MKNVFAPGCALMLHKPECTEEIRGLLEKELGDVGMHYLCCHHEPGLPQGTRIINVCPGCNKRFPKNYEGIQAVTLWELIDNMQDYVFPDYNGELMSLHDSCPVRNNENVHNAVRSLLKKMNITISEPERNRTSSVCCGSSLKNKLPETEVLSLMKARADEMPDENVVVYCISCVKAMHLGGKKPRHLLDLLRKEPTVPGVCDFQKWRELITAYKDAH